MKNTWIVVAHRAGARIFAIDPSTGSLGLLTRHENAEGRLKDGEMDAERNILSDATPTHEIVAENFSKELAQCIEKGRIAHAFEALILVAGPRFLGLLRDALSAPATAMIKQSIDLNLGSLTEEHTISQLMNVLELELPHGAKESNSTSTDTDEPSLFQIQIIAGHGVKKGEGLEREIGLVLNRKLKHFGQRIRDIEVHLSDLNGPKSGPEDKRCLLVGRIAGLEALSVSADSSTLMQAVNGASDKLKHSFESAVGKRDHR
jgi:protein required for attachment to host cells